MNKKNMKQIMFLITFAILMLWGVFNYKLFIDLFLKIINLFTPLFIGLAVAFILNVPMKLL